MPVNAFIMPDDDVVGHRRQLATLDLLHHDAMRFGVGRRYEQLLNGKGQQADHQSPPIGNHQVGETETSARIATISLFADNLRAITA